MRSSSARLHTVIRHWRSMPRIERVRGVEQARLIVAQADRVVLQRDRAQRDRQAVREHADHRLVVLAQIVARAIAEIEHAVELATGGERDREAGRDARERRIPALARDEPRTRGDRAFQARAIDRGLRQDDASPVTPSRSSAPRTYARTGSRLRRSRRARRPRGPGSKRSSTPSKRSTTMRSLARAAARSRAPGGRRAGRPPWQVRQSSLRLLRAVG